MTNHHFQVITEHICSTDCNPHTAQSCLGIDPNTLHAISGTLDDRIYHVQTELSFFFLILASQQTLRSGFALNLFVLGRYIIALLLPFPEYNYFP